MGRIEDALRRAKASHKEHAGGAAQVTAAPWGNAAARDISRERGDGAKPATSIFDDYWRHAQHCMLDSETMQENRIMSDEQPLAIRSAYKMLRTRLLQRMRANRWTRVGISNWTFS